VRPSDTPYFFQMTVAQEKAQLLLRAASVTATAISVTNRNTDDWWVDCMGSAWLNIVIHYFMCMGSIRQPAAMCK